MKWSTVNQSKAPFILKTDPRAESLRMNVQSFARHSALSAKSYVPYLFIIHISRLSHEVLPMAIRTQLSRSLLHT